MKKFVIFWVAAFVATSGVAVAQNGAADNAAGIAKQDKNSTSGTSGSGTSTSGGKDANGNQGRDAMPESNKNVKSLDDQGRKENGAPK